MVPGLLPQEHACIVTHPFAHEAVRPWCCLVREEVLQPWLALRQHAMARGDCEQVHTQPIQGAAQQLPVVVDGVRGAADRQALSGYSPWLSRQ